MTDEINWTPGMTRLKHYALDAEHRVVEMQDHAAWCQWYADLGNRRVIATEISDNVTVSTVFIGLDHRFGDKGPPLLFETLVFGGPMTDTMARYSSWADAVIGHEATVRKVRAAGTSGTS